MLFSALKCCYLENLRGKKFCPQVYVNFSMAIDASKLVAKISIRKANCCTVGTPV